MRTFTSPFMITLIAATTLSAGDAAAQDYGNYLSFRYRAPAAKIESEKPDPAGGERSHTIKVGAQATVCFDTGTLNYPAMWTGGFLNLSQTHHMSSKGKGDPVPVGMVRFTQKTGPGWGVDGGLFPDKRETQAFPMPRELCRYQGLYLHEQLTIVSYVVSGAKILELPGSNGEVFTRTIRIEANTANLCVLLFEDAAAGTVNGLAISAGERAAAISGDTAGLSVTWKDGKALLSIPATSKPRQFTIALGEGAAKNGVAGVAAESTDISTLTKGAASRWKPLTSTGTLGADDKAYTLDTLAMPPNPWNTGWRFGGVDFLPDGRMALCTLNGDVWVVSGVDATLKSLTWTRFATGLYEPLGLAVQNGKILVRGRDQITRLHDLNNDGEADYYENFQNDDGCSTGYHAFAFELVYDKAGNLYYHRTAHKAWTPASTNSGVFKVSPDGQKTEMIANGIKAANGMGVGPDGTVYIADNEDGGEGVPDSPLYVVRQGRNYGCNGLARIGAKPMGAQEMPMLSLTKAYDRSCGGQLWAGAGKFGPLDGLMFHTSYGNSSLFAVMTQDVTPEIRQAAAYRIELPYQSGLMRGRCGPDGQLYVIGQRGWDSNAAQAGCLHRVRYTGKPFFMPVAWKGSSTEMTLTFAAPLDRAVATDAANYAGLSNARTAGLVESGKSAALPLSFKAAELDAAGTGLTLRYAEIPADKSMTCLLKAKFKSASGQEFPLELSFTIRSPAGKK